MFDRKARIDLHVLWSSLFKFGLRYFNILKDEILTRFLANKYQYYEVFLNYPLNIRTRISESPSIFFFFFRGGDGEGIYIKILRHEWKWQ